jgi:hypothetical protein
MRALAPAVLVFAACSSHPARPADRVGNASVLADARSPLAASCPATFAEARGLCSSTDPCTYPEGTCSCSVPPWCGGAAPPDDRPETWQCTPLVRADGCPGQHPPDGTACTDDGQRCDYTCSCLAIATCHNGTWSTENGPCKP